jgi:LmbE family N-acetylglucosaminyl deacetylase
MNYLGVNYELLGFKDDMHNVLYDVTEVENKLRSIINSKKWSKIVTHNIDGEYGHIIHKSIHNIVSKINPDNLHFFKISDTKLDETTFKQKNNLLSFYDRNTDLPGFRDYLIYEGITE